MWFGVSLERHRRLSDDSHRAQGWPDRSCEVTEGSLLERQKRRTMVADERCGAWTRDCRAYKWGHVVAALVRGLEARSRRLCEEDKMEENATRSTRDPPKSPAATPRATSAWSLCGCMPLWITAALD